MSAQSLPELGQRGARWAQGKLGAHPAGYDVPDPETESLLPCLTRANEAGFFTIGSQPGYRAHTDEGFVEQRAFATGYLDRAALDLFRQHLEGAGMLVLDSMIHDEPLAKINGNVVLHGRWRARMDTSLSHISGYARYEVEQAAELDVIDLEWGREDALWSALDAWVAAR